MQKNIQALAVHPAAIFQSQRRYAQMSYAYDLDGI